MDALQSMRAKLTPLGIYNITNSSNIHKELFSYAAALDKHRENLDKLLRECFISSARDYGIEIREKAIGDLRSSYTLEKRREMLTLRNSINENSFTSSSLVKFLKCMGITNYTISENPTDSLIIIRVLNTFSESDKRWILNQLYLFLPSHLKAEVSINNETYRNYTQDSNYFVLVS